MFIGEKKPTSVLEPVMRGGLEALRVNASNCTVVKLQIGLVTPHKQLVLAVHSNTVWWLQWAGGLVPHWSAKCTWTGPAEGSDGQ